MDHLFLRMRKHLFLARRGVRDRIGRIERTVPNSAVALTFDDGPNPAWTLEVLRVLSECEVRATFFVVGANAREHPELLRRIVAEGHAIGSHSATHRVDGRMQVLSAIRDFRAGRRTVEQVLGRPVDLFRPPHGRLNPLTAVLCRLSGFVTWLWSVEAEDWEPGTSAAMLIERYTARTSNGDVLLMHDWIEEPTDPSACDRSALVEALPAVIAALRGRGLRFVALE